MYVARIARPDLLVAITRLASKIHKWTLDSDRKVKRLFDYLQCHCDIYLKGWIRLKDKDIVELWAWPDADLAGDKDSSKSTSGRFLELASPLGGALPLSWGTNKQGGSAHSTPEAETVSLADCMRKEAIPLQRLMSVLLDRQVVVRVWEDNEATITIVEKGYSLALRYLARTQRTSIGMLNELFHPEVDDDGLMKLFHLAYSKSTTHKGDQFTKELDNADFQKGLGFIGMGRLDASSGLEHLGA